LPLWDSETTDFFRLNKSKEYRSPQQVDSANDLLNASKDSLSQVCPDRGCTLISFEIYGGSGKNNYDPLSQDGVQISSYTSNQISLKDKTFISQLMCQDTIYFPDALENLGKFPPQPLEQQYMICHPTYFAAVQTSIGVSNSQATLFSTVAFGLLVTVVLKCCYSKRIVGQGGEKRTVDILSVTKKESEDRVKDFMAKRTLLAAVKHLLETSHHLKRDKKIELLKAISPVRDPFVAIKQS
jgi:hypothetical protein